MQHGLRDRVTRFYVTDRFLLRTGKLLLGIRDLLLGLLWLLHHLFLLLVLIATGNRFSIFYQTFRFCYVNHRSSYQYIKDTRAWHGRLDLDNICGWFFFVVLQLVY